MCYQRFSDQFMGFMVKTMHFVVMFQYTLEQVVVTCILLEVRHCAVHLSVKPYEYICITGYLLAVHMPYNVLCCFMVICVVWHATLPSPT